MKPAPKDVGLPDVPGSETPDAPPLPGGMAEWARLFLNAPQWLQVGMAILGTALGVIVAVAVWRRRRSLVSWLRSLPSAAKAGIIAVVVAVGAVVSVVGYQTHQFVEYDNTFCTGCHLMEEPYFRFEESAHADLLCKDCHVQTRMESARELYLWVVERPDDVGHHSPVPDERCAACHIEEESDDWPYIAASEGHQVHLESDDPDLGRDRCVICHGATVHDFPPVSDTCGECHETEADLPLGDMRGDTELHCVLCHDFMGEEPIYLESVGEVVPMMPEEMQCLACHEMEERLIADELMEDPHEAVCGACHNPHEQKEPRDAVATCRDCHDPVEELTPFHRGIHQDVIADCATCHTAHEWEVDAQDCLACHPAGGIRPTDALEGEGPGAPSAPGFFLALPVPLDTIQERPFTHDEHQTLDCLECHDSGERHPEVTVRTDQDCASCHHDPQRDYVCQDCHREEDLPGEEPVPATLSLSVWEEAQTRDLPFDHHLHQEVQCEECHQAPVTMDVETECAACHDDHHVPEAECTRCHLPTDDEVHGLESHFTCASAGCHEGDAGQRPELSRTLCLACHQDQDDHEPGLVCHECHVMPEPVGHHPEEAEDGGSGGLP